jgi:hypothetical protein
MAVHSVSTGLPPSYGVSGSTSPTARSAAIGKGLAGQSFAKANTPQFTSGSETTDTQFQSTLEQELREGTATTGRSASGSSGSPTGQSPAGIALYQRVSQYGNNEPQTSALLKSWTTIMQGGAGADSAAAAFAKALSQSETPGSESGVLDLTA